MFHSVFLIKLFYVFSAFHILFDFFHREHAVFSFGWKKKNCSKDMEKTTMSIQKMCHDGSHGTPLGKKNKSMMRRPLRITYGSKVIDRTGERIE